METQVMYDSPTNFVTTAHEVQNAQQLCVKVGTSIKLIEMVNIAYVQAAGNYVGIVMVGGETVHTKETISHIAERLPLRLFVRIHRSCIVNIRCIREIKSRQNNYEFTLNNGTRILSGTTYRKATRERFSASLGRTGPTSKIQLPTNTAHVAKIPSVNSWKPLADVKTCIRTCTQGDEYALAFLGKISFLQTYVGAFRQEDVLEHSIYHDAPTTYRAWLENRAARVWIVETETGHIPVGYMVVAPPSMPFAQVCPDDLEIHRIYLLKSFQGGGLGKNLMAMAVQHAKQVGCHRLLLGDYHENRSAIGFYQYLGFHPIGEYLCRVASHDYSDVVFSLEI